MDGVRDTGGKLFDHVGVGTHSRSRRDVVRGVPERDGRGGSYQNLTEKRGREVVRGRRRWREMYNMWLHRYGGVIT